MNGDPKRERAATWCLFLALALLGTAWSVGTPLMAVPDEPAHVIRAVAVAHGDVVGRDVVTETDDPELENRTDTFFTIPDAYGRVTSLPTCFAFELQQTADCAPELEATDAPDGVANTYTGTYQPLYSALVGWPSRVFDPEPAVHLMRAITAVMCAALAALGFLGVRRADPSGFSLIGYLFALTPSVLFFFGGVNPTSLETAAALAVWGTSLEIFRSAGPLTRSAAVRFTIAAVAMAWARPLSAAFLVFIVGTVWLLAGSRARWAELRRDRTVWTVGAITAVSTLAAASWVVWRRAYDSFAGNPWPGLTRADAIRISFEQLWGRVEQMVAVFGWLDTRPPSIVIISWLAVTGALGVGALVVGRARSRLVLIGLLVVIVVEPTVAEMSRAERYGFVWQGRYSLPLAVGLPILAATIIGWSGRIAPRARSVATLGALGLWAGGQVLAFSASMRRYRTGQGTPIFSWITEGRWMPPVSPSLIVVTVVVGLVLVVAAVAATINFRASWRGG